MKQAVILAGGKSTRLRERLGELPKPLIDICGVPLLERQILLLKKYGFNDVKILVNYASEKIIEYCNSKDNWEINISCIDDGEPLGTAGATLRIFDQLAPEFLVMYGDTMLEVDLDTFYNYHIQNTKIAATLFLHPNDHPADSDLVEIDDNGIITRLHPYPHDSSRFYQNLVNAALYWINKEQISPWKHNTGILDFAKDLFPQMLSKNLLLRGYNCTEYIKDCGTPNRLDTVCNDFLSNKINNCSLHSRQKAVFIDRDGTINEEKDHLITTEQFLLLPDVTIGIKALNESDYLTCVITNQPVVARGECSLLELKEIHNKMETLLGKQGAFVNRIYYCPHHPDSGYQGEIEELKINCSCRKPNTGMIDKAVNELNILRRESWLIGDSSSDILTAKRAGLKSILVETGYAGLDQKFWAQPDFTVPDLNKAVEFILNKYWKIYEYCMNFISSIKAGDTIVIGGLSKSGKSSFANVLRYALNDYGKSSQVISLDRLLRNEIEEIFRIVRDNQNHPYNLKLPVYHKLLRQKIIAVEEIEIEPTDIVILEGTIALVIDKNQSVNNHRFHLKIDEVERKKRVIKEYLLRNYSWEKANKIYDSRNLDETTIIEKPNGKFINVNMSQFY